MTGVRASLEDVRIYNASSGRRHVYCAEYWTCIIWHLKLSLSKDTKPQYGSQELVKGILDSA